jgi:hypothetical protein
VEPQTVSTVDQWIALGRGEPRLTDEEKSARQARYAKATSRWLGREGTTLQGTPDYVLREARTNRPFRRELFQSVVRQARCKRDPHMLRVARPVVRVCQRPREHRSTLRRRARSPGEPDPEPEPPQAVVEPRVLLVGVAR